MLMSWGRHLLPSFIQFEVLSLVSDFECNLDVLCYRIRILLDPLFQLLSPMASVKEGRLAPLLPVGVYVKAPRPPLALLGGASCATPERRGASTWVPRGGGGPGSHLFSLTASQVGWEGSSQPRGDGTQGSPTPCSCWVGGCGLAGMGQFSLSASCPAGRASPGPLGRETVLLGVVVCSLVLPGCWCLQLQVWGGDANGRLRDSQPHHPRLLAALLSSPLPLPAPSHCAVLCCLGFSVGLKGRGLTCPLISHHVSPSARFESSSQPERAGCLEGLCGCFQDWSSESLSSTL